MHHVKFLLNCVIYFNSLSKASLKIMSHSNETLELGWMMAQQFNSLRLQVFCLDHH